MTKKSQEHLAKKFCDTSKLPQQSAWFRVWIGFLIGANVAFMMFALYISTNPNHAIRQLLPLGEGIAFVVLGAIDIWFMIKLLQWKRFGVYGAIALPIVGAILAAVWGAEIVSVVILAVVVTAITLAFVLPQWSLYK